jgi:hypothetical protein
VMIDTSIKTLSGADRGTGSIVPSCRYLA